MAKLWKNIWNVPNINIDIRWNPQEDGQKSGKAAIELLEALKNNVPDAKLGPIIGNINSLLDVLNLSLLEIAAISDPLVSLATRILNKIYQNTKQTPNLETCLALSTQAAYLESLRQFLKDRPEIERKLDHVRASTVVAETIARLGKKLQVNDTEIQLNVKEAETTFVCFHESNLARAFNPILMARWQESGLTYEESRIATERVSRIAHRYMERILIEVKDIIPLLRPIYGARWHRDLETFISIDTYLENVIANKPREYFLDRHVSLSQTYVPLEIQPLKANGQINDRARAIDIETWVQKKLTQEQRIDRVLFVQAESGRGKSIFCRIFADWVRRELHPLWTPILIPLRNIKSLGSDFEATIRNILGWNFIQNDPGWPSNSNTRFLFLLDGLDELPLNQKSSNLQFFLEQIDTFQKQCQEDSKMGHRVLITSRPLKIYPMQQLVPSRWHWVEINPMKPEIQETWLQKWEKTLQTLPGGLSGQRSNFKEFVANNRCPKQIKALIQEPIIIYLLALIHAERPLDRSRFEGLSNNGAKIFVYQQVIEWALRKQIAESSPELKFNSRDVEELNGILLEAGIALIQLRQEYVPIWAVEKSLERKGDSIGKQLIAKLQQQSQQDVLKIFLATFHSDSIIASNSIEFCHKSFAEFFCGQYMSNTIGKWTIKLDKQPVQLPGGSQNENYAIDNENLAKEIYDLFGYGNLNPELVELLIGVLEKNRVDLITLFERLNDFYLRWSKGEFIEAIQDSMPQRKARDMEKQNVTLGQREIDIYVGLNVLVLLLELHRYAQNRSNLKDRISFYICGQIESESFDRYRLLRIIGYSQCLEAFAFNYRVGMFLRGADLSGVVFRGLDLKGIDFTNTILKGADLSVTDLRNANISDADLREANLTNAVLRNANLNGTDLTDANLSRADLSGANLGSTLLVRVDLAEADLSGADLSSSLISDANLSGTDLSGSDFREAIVQDIESDSETKWINTIGLKTKFRN